MWGLNISQSWHKYDRRTNFRVFNSKYKNVHREKNWRPVFTLVDRSASFKISIQCGKTNERLLRPSKLLQGDPVWQMFEDHKCCYIP